MNPLYRLLSYLTTPVLAIGISACTPQVVGSENDSSIDASFLDASCEGPASNHNCLELPSMNYDWFASGSLLEGQTQI